MSQFTFINLFFIVLSIFSPLWTDTITLKNSKVIQNVQAKLKGKYILLTYENGKKQKIKKVTVKSFKPIPVHWTFGQSLGEQRKKLYEKERIRVADALIANTDWQIPEGEKPRLILLKFHADSGISREKAEIYSGLVKAKISKTNLFTLIDSRSIEKALKGKKCRGVECARHVPENLQANKILTGTITKTGKYIFISADVVDIKKRSIDFSDSIVIEELSQQGIERSIEFLAKKITGGALEFLEQQAMQNPYQGKVVKWPLIWRSTLVPGWGQWRDGSAKKAIAFASASALSLLAYGVSYGNFQKQQKQYRNFNGIPYIASDFNSLFFGETFWLSYFVNNNNRIQVEKAKQNTDRYAMLFAAIWTLNVLDIIFLSEGELPPKKLNVKIQPDATPEGSQNPGGKVSIGIQYNF